ncbi:MAG: class I mannose-6-phosphate isomerase [Acidobacteriota bacterium]
MEPLFTNTGAKIGEVWFEGSAEFPLLIKFLFTTEKLSVQVHPKDDYAREHHSSLGKTEMWHILRAEPGAQIAAGFREDVSPEKMRAAAESGEIEQMLAWHDALPGDTFFIPAGTVHAIGAGLMLCEIQQSSDITYRLYDYGRYENGKPRELHLDHGVRVSRLQACEARQQPASISDEAELLVQCPYFTTERHRIRGTTQFSAEAYERRIVVLDGSGQIGGNPVKAGEVWRVDGGTQGFDVSGELTVLVTHS